MLWRQVGTVRAEDCMDDGTPICLAVTIDRGDGSAIFDFEGAFHFSSVPAGNSSTPYIELEERDDPIFHQPVLLHVPLSTARCKAG